MKFLKNKKLLTIVAIVALCLYIAVPRIIAYIGNIMMYKAMSAPVKVELTTPHYEDYYKKIESSGRLDANYYVDIVARVQGWIMQTYFKEGDYVKQGDLLFLIEPDEYKIAVQKAQAAVSETKANLINAEKDLVRAKELVKQDFVSRSYYDQVLAKRDSLRGSLSVQQAALADAKLNLSYTRIKSPITGKIGKIIITKGNLVNAQSGALAKVISTSPMYAYFSLKSEDFLDFKKAAKPNDKDGLSSMVVKIKLANGSVYPENGDVEFIDNEIDPNLGTISLRAKFANKDNVLVKGDYITVTATSTEKQRVLLIPIETAQESEQGMYVACVDDNDVVSQRFIKVNGQKGNYWIVTDGLSDKDRIVFKGLQKVQVGKKVEVITPATENDKDKK